MEDMVYRKGRRVPEAQVCSIISVLERDCYTRVVQTAAAVWKCVEQEEELEAMTPHSCYASAFPWVILLRKNMVVFIPKAPLLSMGTVTCCSSRCSDGDYTVITRHS